MRRLSISSLAALAALAAFPAGAVCPTPGPAPSVPDGTIATADQMKATRQAVQEYVNTLQGYQDCLEAQIKSAPKDTKTETLQRWRDQGNAAISQAEALKTSYSTQLKAYKVQHPQ